MLGVELTTNCMHVMPHDPYVKAILQCPPIVKGMVPLHLGFCIRIEMCL